MYPSVTEELLKQNFELNSTVDHNWLRKKNHKTLAKFLSILQKLYLLHSHNHDTYTSGNIVNSIMTSEHTSLEKYTSHTLFGMVAKGLRKGYVWEVSWRLNRDCNILTPSSSVFSSTSFSFRWAAQAGALRAQPSAESWFSLPRTATTDSKLTELPVAPGYIIVWCDLLPESVVSASNSTRPQSTLYPDIFDRMHLFLDRRLGRRSICYISGLQEMLKIYLILMWEFFRGWNLQNHEKKKKMENGPRIKKKKKKKPRLHRDGLNNFRSRKVDCSGKN